MIDENKISKVLSKINRDTIEKKINWVTVDNRTDLQLSSSEYLVGKIYETEFNKRVFRLFKINEAQATYEMETVWIPAYKLIILDETGEIDWEFPDYRSISDLYNTVRYKVAGMDSFFDGIKDLDDEKDEIKF